AQSGRRRPERAGRRNRSAVDGILLVDPVVLEADAQTMIVVRLQRALDEPEVAAHLDRYRRVVQRLVLLNAAIGSEEPRLVAQDRTAQREVRLNVLAAVRRDSLHVRGVEALRNHE